MSHPNSSLTDRSLDLAARYNCFMSLDAPPREVRLRIQSSRTSCYQVDGVIVASTSLSSGFARECRQAGVPIVLFNRRTDDADISSVTGDNEAGGAAIAGFLLAGKHRRLAFIAGLEESSTSRDRERGFREALTRAGVSKLQRAVGNYIQKDAADATRSLLRQKQRPDAIFCANDHMAIACLEVARHEFGLRVPEDLSVVGFDDAGLAGWPTFNLTMFSQPAGPMVEATVGMIIDFMARPDQPARRCIVGGKLVVRGSAKLPEGEGPWSAAGIRR